MGTVVAGGMLGMLIVPSILIIIYSVLAGESVGKMFLGALIPGLLLAFLFIIQIGIRCYVNPKLGPPITEEVRWKDKIDSLKGIIFPFLLITLILWGIYSGTFTPTEASGIGAVGAIAAAAIHRNLNIQMLRDSVYSTFRLTGMVFWLIVAAKFFGAVFSICGAQKLITESLIGLTTSPWVILIMIQLTLFILCMFVDDFPIMLLTVPIYVPIISKLGFDTLWFGVLFILNMNIAWITPPYGFNLFYARALAPEGMTMADIYRSVLPFIVCQIVCLILVMLFPQIVLWLPNLIMK
jgi:tripartite ATP-independent transporter DctM subunit